MQQTFLQTDIQEMEQRYRSTFINSISGFKNCVLIGTQNTDGSGNLALFNTCIHVGADPAALGILFRPREKSDTYANIKRNGYFSVNHVHKDFYRQAHQSSARYEPGESEFDAVGLGMAFLPGYRQVPVVRESRIRLILRLAEEHTVSLNNTLFMVGLIEAADIHSLLLNEDGYIDAAAAESVCVNGLDAYHMPARLSRMTYARRHETSRPFPF